MGFHVSFQECRVKDLGLGFSVGFGFEVRDWGFSLEFGVEGLELRVGLGFGFGG